MKALMFGWEFPPHILGGLGTASYGLTKGMAECGDIDITFVIPKPYGAFMTLSFMALTVIPTLRLTTRGVFDVINQRYV